jgi:uncharacterized membrane protein
VNSIGRNWHEVYLLVLTILFAVTGWLTDSKEQIITATFPAWAQSFWYGGLAAGAVLALVGIALHTLTGLLVERAGLFALAGLCGAYGLTFGALAGRVDPVHSVAITLLVFAFAAVNLARAGQIRREVNGVRHDLRKLASPEVT